MDTWKCVAPDNRPITSNNLEGKIGSLIAIILQFEGHRPTFCGFIDNCDEGMY